MTNTAYSIDISDNSDTILKEIATQAKDDTTDIEKLFSFVAVLHGHIASLESNLQRLTNFIMEEK